MASMDRLRVRDLVDNPTPRVPVVLCLDTSGSMNAVDGDDVHYTGETVFSDGRMWNIVEGGTTRLEQLRDGINMFLQDIREDDLAQFAAEVCIVTFDSQARCLVDFSTVDHLNDIPELEANEDTHMGEGVNLALDLLEKRKKEYKEKGVDYYQPWLVLMTDGEANGDQSELERAIERTNTLIQNKKLTIFPIGIGEEAGMQTLAKFSPKRSPLRLKKLKFREFFAWLSDSVSRTSQSMPGESVHLDTEAIKGWGTLD
ncbi:vWA domain-containing protein [Mitsuokella jalaludinii]|uniref:vWA domain-containing protein n=1 Tax=Mitsuokella jalaludinii TaxID=187979 RepID=UPI003F8BE9FD